MQKGWALSEQGNHEKGLEMLLKGLEIWRAVGMVVFVPYWHSLIAGICVKLNNSERGITLLSESFEKCLLFEHVLEIANGPLLAE